MLDIADFTHARRHMVAHQIQGRGIRGAAVLAAMTEVPREAFVANDLAEFAYDDRPLPIGEGQTISQPFIVALMVAAAGIKAGDRVLEVGAGSGYAAAILSSIAAQVYGIERHPALVEQARERLAGLGYGNVRLQAGDGTAGWPSAAPFDAIIVSAGGSCVPAALKDQLAPGGRLVMPVGDQARGQTLFKITRLGVRDFSTEALADVRFVPLVGAEG